MTTCDPAKIPFILDLDDHNSKTKLVSPFLLKLVGVTFNDNEQLE